MHTAEPCRVQLKMGPFERGVEHRNAGEIWEVWGDKGEIREMWGDIPCLGVRAETRTLSGCEIWGDMGEIREMWGDRVRAETRMLSGLTSKWTSPRPCK